MSDIVERLKAWSPMIEAGYNVPAAGTVMNEAAAEIEGLRAANAALRQSLEEERDALRANNDENAELEARLAEAVEVVRDVTPALIAAISLLERGGKKAAASDKMFAQMLADYSASVERARDLLAKLEGRSGE